MFTLKFKSRALKSAKKLSREEKEKVKEDINIIRSTPFNKYDMKRLKATKMHKE